MFSLKLQNRIFEKYAHLIEDYNKFANHSLRREIVNIIGVMKKDEKFNHHKLDKFEKEILSQWEEIVVDNV